MFVTVEDARTYIEKGVCMFFKVQIEFGLQRYETVHECASYQHAIRRAKEELDNDFALIVRVQGDDEYTYYEDHNF